VQLSIARTIVTSLNKISQNGILIQED
jgi:hypothetical protein